MSEFRPVVRSNKKHYKKLNTYTWETLLHEFEKGKAKFVPLDAFNVNLRVDCNDTAKERIVFEAVNHAYDDHCDGVEVRWFFRVEKACGYRVLGHFIGDTAPNSKFWMNILSEDIHYISNYSAKAVDQEMKNIAYVPPPSVMDEYAQDIKTYIDKCIAEELELEPALSVGFEKDRDDLHKPHFHVGQRLELLHYTNSTIIRVARIQEICGRRLNVLVMKKDHPGALDNNGVRVYPSATDDRQFENKGAQYWIDEGSFLIFPVGFAMVNGYELQANPDYIEHTRRIADAINDEEAPMYHQDDITFDQLKKDPVNLERFDKLKVGQKFELIDPLAQEFKVLHVATMLRSLKTPGYIIVGMDGPDMEEDSFPLHIGSPFIYPVGYAAKHGLSLQKPDKFKGAFKWDDYLKKEKADAMPIELFRPMPPKERLDKFEIGMHLEAADMCENHFICSATITGVHGRIINVNFDGWGAEFDELYDIDSHDIFPIGWCEYHNYLLQHPKRHNY